MAPFLLFLLLSVSSLCHSSSSEPVPVSFRFSGHHRRPLRPNPSIPSTSSSPSAVVNQTCSATRFPDTCVQTLSRAPSTSAVDLIKFAIDASATSLATAQSMANSILGSPGSDANRTNAARNCIELLSFSAYRLGLASDTETIRSRTKDARSWLSAGLTYQYDCWSALKYVNTTQQIDSAMAFLADLQNLTSNALSMVFALDRFGDDTSLWRAPQTERDGLPAPSGSCSSSSAKFARGGFEGLKPDVVVCKDGSGGCLGTIQKAVDSAPDNGTGTFVIKINEGVYEELVKVPLSKRNIVFLGDGMGKTVITGSLNAQMVAVSTYNTATVAVNGDGFMASGITFQNTAGPDSHQAVAFRSESDMSLIENCEFLGHQDTLYAHTLRQLYRSCRIQGTVDFIFGNSASVFQNCTILVAPRQLNPEKGETNTVTAHGRTDPAQATGFVFDKCAINGTSEYLGYYNSKPAAHKVYLGRPWKLYSRTVFLRSYLDTIIRPEGWLVWDGDFALNTLYYGEFENYGPGANVSGRVSWSSQIPAQNACMYSLESFIQGNEWISSH